MEKMKILMLCDHPLVPSGVGTQARYLIEGLLETGKFKFTVFGGAMKHPDYRRQNVSPEKYGEDWIIYPVDGYGDKDKMREALRVERPDAVLLFTDPRFFTWVWEMEDDIRRVCPILYWHVWDNDPAPEFNRVFYESTDFVSALSMKTHMLLRDVGYPRERHNYIPHAVSPEIFKKVDEATRQDFRNKHFGPHANKEFIVFWNNRNARRKMTGDVIASFAKFAHSIGKEKTSLAMHTSVTDPEGQNILEVAKKYDVSECLLVSESRVPPEIINGFYNSADVTVNIANNEGFGLSTLESLMAGTPIVVNMTGGLQFQIGPWWKDAVSDPKVSQEDLTDLARRSWRKNPDTFFGIPVFPETRSCTGSQQIPYIYDDRVSHESVKAALQSLYTMGKERREMLGKAGAEWARREFNLSKMISDWDSTLTKTILKWRNDVSRKSFTVVSV